MVGVFFRFGVFLDGIVVLLVFWGEGGKCFSVGFLLVCCMFCHCGCFGCFS